MSAGTFHWSGLTELIFHLGVLAQAAYLADPGKRLMGVWVFVAFVTVPYGALFLFRHGEHSEETVARAHLLGALWYLALTMISFALAFSGYRPPSWVGFLVLMAPGAAVSMKLIAERLRDPPSPSLPTE
jgi:hypothetical protein